MDTTAAAGPGWSDEPVGSTSDADAFERLIEPLRDVVHAHCYRMLGSLSDADDATQETMIRGWRALGRFEGRSTARTWLLRIATNVCIDIATRRGKRELPMDLGSASAQAQVGDQARLDISWLQPYPDQALAALESSPSARYELLESVELAFVAALQQLPPNERAALLLFDVLGYSAREIGEIMATSTAAVTSALQRARNLIQARQPSASQAQSLRTQGDQALSALVEAYTSAVQRGDADAVIALLTEDARWAMPPLPSWYQGHPAIRDFLQRMALRARWRHRPTRANGQLAVAGYLWNGPAQAYTAYALDVFTLHGDRIGQVTSFLDASLFPRWGLPAQLDG